MRKYEITISKKDCNKDYVDIWGAATLWIDDSRGVEYNYSYDTQTCSSAIYKWEDNGEDDKDILDTSTFIDYEVDFNDSEWQQKLVNAMEMAAKEFFRIKEV